MRRSGTAVAAPGDCEVAHHLADGAVNQAQRVLQLQDDARWQFLLAEGSVTTARRAASGDCEPLQVPPPASADEAIALERSPQTSPSVVVSLVCAALAATAGLIISLNATTPPVPVATVALAVTTPEAGADAAPPVEPASPAAQRAESPALHDLGKTVYAARFAGVGASERTCLARAIYYEARGETNEGQIAVAQVVLNRVRSKKWPKSICGVVNQGVERGEKCQFSFSCNTRLAQPSGVLWDEAELVAEQAISGRGWLRELMDATHYHTTAVAPIWRLGLVEQATIGSHVFYREATGLRESLKVAQAYAALASVKATRASLVPKPAVLPASPAKTGSVQANVATESAPAKPERAKIVEKAPVAAPPRKVAGGGEADWKTSIFEH